MPTSNLFPPDFIRDQAVMNKVLISLPIDPVNSSPLPVPFSISSLCLFPTALLCVLSHSISDLFAFSFSLSISLSLSPSLSHACYLSHHPSLPHPLSLPRHLSLCVSFGTQCSYHGDHRVYTYDWVECWGTPPPLGPRRRWQCLLRSLDLGRPQSPPVWTDEQADQCVSDSVCELVCKTGCVKD